MNSNVNVLLLSSTRLSYKMCTFFHLSSCEISDFKYLVQNNEAIMLIFFSNEYNRN